MLPLFKRCREQPYKTLRSEFVLCFCELFRDLT